MSKPKNLSRTDAEAKAAFDEMRVAEIADSRKRDGDNAMPRQQQTPDEARRRNLTRARNDATNWLGIIAAKPDLAGLIANAANWYARDLWPKPNTPKLTEGKIRTAADATPIIERLLQKIDAELREIDGKAELKEKAQPGVGPNVDQSKTLTSVDAETPDKCTAGIARIHKAHLEGRRITVTELAAQLGETRPALYENAAYAPLREAGNKLFGMFNRKAGKGDWDGPTQGEV